MRQRSAQRLISTTRLNGMRDIIVCRLNAAAGPQEQTRADRRAGDRRKTPREISGNTLGTIFARTTGLFVVNVENLTECENNTKDEKKREVISNSPSFINSNFARV